MSTYLEGEEGGREERESILLKRKKEPCFYILDFDSLELSRDIKTRWININRVKRGSINSFRVSNNFQEGSALGLLSETVEKAIRKEFKRRGIFIGDKHEGTLALKYNTPSIHNSEGGSV